MGRCISTKSIGTKILNLQPKCIKHYIALAFLVTVMRKRTPDPSQIEQLNKLIDTLRGIMRSGESCAEFEMAMKAQIRKQVDIIHAKPIFASHKMHTVDGKEVPTYWYTANPDDYKKKITAPTKEKLYGKLIVIYTEQGYQFTKNKKAINSEYSLRKIFEAYIEKDLSITKGSKNARSEVWNLYLEGSPLADMDIRDITASVLMNAYHDIFAAGTVKGSAFTKKYFSDIHGCVHAVYKYAITYMGLNLIDLPKSIDYSMLPFRPTGSSSDDIQAASLTREEFQRALFWCREHQKDGAALAIWFNFYLGLRYAELSALRWCDVDLKRRMIHVCGHIDKERVRQPFTKKKTAEGMRYIPLIDDAVKVFRLILEKKPEDAAPDDLVFPLNGYSTLLRRCKDCFRYSLETEVLPEHYVTHSLRATAASLWYVNGVPEKTIKKLLGHTTIQMTMRYCHDLTTLEETRESMAYAMAANS